MSSLRRSNFSNASFDKADLYSLSSKNKYGSSSYTGIPSSSAPCRIGRQVNLKRERGQRKESIFGSLDKLLGAGAGASSSGDDDYDSGELYDVKCNETFPCDVVVEDHLDLKDAGIFELDDTSTGTLTFKEHNHNKMSSSGSLGKLAEKARSLSRRAKDSLSASSSHHNIRGGGGTTTTRSCNGGSLKGTESHLDRKKRLLLGSGTSTSSFSSGEKKSTSTTRRKTSSPSKKGKNGKSSTRSDKLFKASQAETLAILVAQELDGMDC